MVKKQSGSSQPAKPIRVNAESIGSKPLSKRQKVVVDGVAKSQAGGDDGHIDYSDIPALSEKQLAQFKRAPKKLVLNGYESSAPDIRPGSTMFCAW